MSVTFVVQRYRVSMCILYKHESLQALQPTNLPYPKVKKIGKMVAPNRALSAKRPVANVPKVKQGPAKRLRRGVSTQ